MLNLSGKAGDQFFINDDIIITIVKNSGGIVYLGFDAPMKHSIHRKVVFDRIKNEGSLSERDKQKAEEN